ncbi:putative lipid II flippase FtsW [Candidatus Woesebacteria bacterium]|nr:putative lipid II flippase FtsW [Candidatus Woesebacteria bacterium]
MRKDRRQIVEKSRGVDKPLLILVLILTGIGLIAVADASAPQALNFFKDELYFFKQQAVWAAIGVALLILVSFIKYNFWEKIATPLFFINVLLLMVVLAPGVGISALGARRWIDLGVLSFQPSELIKLSLILYLAKVASREKGALAYFLPLVAVSALIMLQPDLGTTLVVVMVSLVQIFIAGVNLFYFVGGAIIAGVTAAVLILISPYRRERLLTFLESTRDPLDSSYHIRQILLALGSGGFAGVGLGASRQKYLFLPEAATDSIFAVLAEEIGFVGSLAIIILFAAIVLRGLKIANNAPDKFSQVASIGIVAWITTQFFLNISSMVALTPLTGVPLPLISYGGTALTTILLATGILLNISRYAKAKRAN